MKDEIVHRVKWARMMAHIFLLEYPEAKGSSLAENKGYKLPELSTKKLLETGFNKETDFFLNPHVLQLSKAIIEIS
ncbi:hypothetical protein QYF36_027208 [Acer negundo]|nr:hypothetical protein QYF36_027208 [Acer negundo]